MEWSEVRAPYRVGLEPSVDWLDNIVICGSLAGGMLLGGYVGKLLGGLAAYWLGMGVGGALFGGLGYYVRATFRSQLGHPLAAIRIVLLLLFVGVDGFVATVWMGKFGAFIGFILIPILINCLVAAIRILNLSIRAVYSWSNRKTHHAYGSTSLLWDVDLDQHPVGAGKRFATLPRPVDDTENCDDRFVVGADAQAWNDA